MKPRQMSRGTSLLLAVLVALAPPVVVWAGTASYSGTILALDATAGAMTLGEIGPWRVRAGVTEVTRRVITLTPETECTLVERTPGPGPRGWLGDFVEVTLSRQDLKTADFVTVRVRQEGERLTALKVWVVAATEP